MDDLLKLTYEERGALEAVSASNAPWKEFQRAQALSLLDENGSVTEIAHTSCFAPNGLQTGRALSGGPVASSAGALAKQ
jgi:hypothetical protein